jgi:hypothetical protein
MRLIFLDIDGVLNDHAKLPSQYCGINLDRAKLLNGLLEEVPDAMLVISSAWRYLIYEGNMTLKGFEYLLMVHGVCCHERIHGITERDPAVTPHTLDVEAWRKNGIAWRAEQIRCYVAQHKPERYVVLDDLPLMVDNFVQTDGKIGLTDSSVEDALRFLRHTHYADA